jgi:hypothetical protein
MAKKFRFNLQELNAVVKCFFDQLFDFTEFTNSLGFVHVNLHEGNVLLTTSIHNDRAYPLVKVSDF